MVVLRNARVLQSLLFAPHAVGLPRNLYIDEGYANEADRGANKCRRRRDALRVAPRRFGWEIEKPGTTNPVRAKMAEKCASMGSVECSRLLLRKAKVAISPGLDFGESGEGYVRFALVDDEHMMKQAVKGIKNLLYFSGKK